MLTKIVFLAVCVFVARISAQDIEFEKKKDLITKMDDIYEKVLETDVYDDTLRFNLEQQIKSDCGPEIEGSGQWILNLMTVDGSDNILRKNFIDNYSNMTKTKEFFNETTTVLMNAIKIDFWCRSKMGNRAAAASLVDFQKSSQTTLDDLAATIDQLVHGWEENLKHDITQILASGNHKLTLKDEIKQTLQANYSYGDWMIVVFEGVMNKTECFEEGIFHYLSPSVKNHSVLVALTPSTNKDISDKARTRLNKIGSSRWVEGSCNNLTSQIMNESGFTCGSGEFTFFGVYELEPDMFSSIASTTTKTNLMYTGITTRLTSKQTCHYNIVIFA